ncbi:hypothetical protein LOK74_15630 [Brevibacillus humidisoli]|uniref:hypothetical protein n=1 Tax=Brevibacillus humidisoli TaxID=2895522 RepID=UPI001E6333B7|nr:hypothetical protein [Brevibacillus humidisoli]UFJ39480.1 hypothetical protein LOK74_15630 [Brevibacillus humidisoli]
MKIGKILLICCFLFSLFILEAYIPNPLKADVLDSKYLYNDEQQTLKEIKKQKNMQVFVFDSFSFPEDLSESIDIEELDGPEPDYEQIEQREKTNKIKTLIIDDKMAEQLLSKESFKKLDKFLDKGYSIHFKTDSLDLYTKLYEITSSGDHAVPEKRLKEGQEQIYLALSKTKSGKYVRGAAFARDHPSDEEVNKLIIVNAWHRQKDHEVSHIMKLDETKFRLLNTARAEDFDEFNVENGWDEWGWNYENDYSSFGDARFWYQFADLWDESGDAYIGYMGQAHIDPDNDDVSDPEYETDQFEFQIDFDHFNDEGYDNHAFDYDPKQSPEKTTWQYSVGGGLSGVVSGTEYGGSIGITSQISMTEDEYDIYVEDESDVPDDEEVNVEIKYRDYDIPWSTAEREYVVAATVQNFAAITQSEPDYIGDGDYKTKLRVDLDAWFSYIAWDDDPYDTQEQVGDLRDFTLTFSRN